MPSDNNHTQERTNAALAELEQQRDQIGTRAALLAADLAAAKEEIRELQEQLAKREKPQKVAA